MKHKWVVFFHNGKELLRYTLYGEADGERNQTIQMLAYENDLLPCEISFAIINI